MGLEWYINDLVTPKLLHFSSLFSFFLFFLFIWFLKPYVGLVLSNVTHSPFSISLQKIYFAILWLDDRFNPYKKNHKMRVKYHDSSRAE